MTNVAHNGFGCPYCRAEMAEVPEDSDDEDDDSEYYEEYEEDLLDDYSLRGFRWLFQRAEGEELDDEPDDEFEDDESDYEEDLAQPPQFVQTTRTWHLGTLYRIICCSAA